ncbi:coproporphyrinogen oxidase [Winogradskyella pacifica]|uniref:coproporphyrinogen oxidase n=2 Tax=Winogradskyella pacifica TaxID=664642 RepID=A0A3D9LPD7_9FLAO|nr:coproporphyrinogen oxidase [Winogradskyella pacifica]
MELLKEENYYHIYNRGINSEVIFKDENNMNYFLKLVAKYLSPNVNILAYCLLNNHFHFAIEVTSETKEVNQAFSNLFNAYTKAYNKQNYRTGALLERPFKRKQIKNEDYLKQLILYIHKNPENHNIVNDFKTYEFSSFKSYVSENDALISQKKSYIIGLFDDSENFIITHTKKNSIELNMENDNSRPTRFEKPARSPMKDKFFNYIHQLQDTITSKLEEVDGKAKFQEDNWDRPEGGGGRTRVIENGNVFEKGGVNISGVHGKLPDSMQKYFGVEDADFFACGLSLVLHPTNPMVPTVHANWRYFEMYDKEGNIVDQWFGGGQDLTPYYLFEDDAKHFHQTCKTACDKHNPEFYPKYKSRCDDYFYNAHRNEGRGIGGLFFDYCKATDEMSMQNWYDFVTEVGDSFLEAYVPIVEKRKTLEYTKPQRDWQEIRRGRYVEFNLVHDKGTLFGLKTNGRIESILMSLPPHVQWVYDHQPEAGSEEEKLINVLQNPVDWV